MILYDSGATQVEEAIPAPPAPPAPSASGAVAPPPATYPGLPPTFPGDQASSGLPAVGDREAWLKKKARLLGWASWFSAAMRAPLLGRASSSYPSGAASSESLHGQRWQLTSNWSKS